MSDRTVEQHAEIVRKPLALMVEVLNDEACRDALGSLDALARLAADTERRPRFEVVSVVGTGHSVCNPDGTNTGVVFSGPESYALANAYAEKLAALASPPADTEQP